MIRLPFHSFR